MRLLVVGAGSTGGYYGGRLAQAGRDVTFLVRPGRAAQLQENGLQIVSPYGDFTCTPKLVTAGQIRGPYDAVILTVKAYSLEAALEDLAPAIGPQTMILPVLNGMRHVEAIRARFGAQTLVGGLCRIPAQLDDAGRVIQMGKFHDLAYGEMDGSTSSRITALDAALKNAGFDAKLTSEIEREMWEKWTLLAALGGICCLMRGTVGEVAAAPGGGDFSAAIVDEVVGAVRAVGKAPSESFVASTREALTKVGSTHTSSMYRDLQKGAAVEADQIVGDLLRRAQQAGIAMPLLSLAYANLCVYQSRRAA
ncbi:2-dehydropantoate 2-reductase [Ferrovibrio terrae]|uniref:2-dehydropantoate 2-reductase n=1 Tax=Ferrovibrio terrae TaxID=2594003 RepID=A0A516H6W0_9PROT|nr:2-dehydropantoate 2-reductase [Ferrovibrio terrae]QDO99506.1 2-dehydropantoate 2-reductase [Ferrovibrio terrae]